MVEITKCYLNFKADYLILANFLVGLNLVKVVEGSLKILLITIDALSTNYLGLSFMAYVYGHTSSISIV